MKKLLLITIISLSFINIFSQQKVTVVAKEANVRSEPNLQAAVVGKVKRKTTLDFTATEKSWYYVSFGEIAGWIHSSTVKTPEWVYVGETDGNPVYYDSKRITKRNNLVKIRIQSRDGKDNEILTKGLIEIDCTERKARILSSASYYTLAAYSYGRITRTKNSTPEVSDTPNAKFKVIVPETVNDLLAKDVCKL